MTFFLPETVAGRVALGSEVRIILDAAPQYRDPGQRFLRRQPAQFTPKTVETASERQKLMFRVRAQIAQELLREHLQAGQDRLARRGLGQARRQCRSGLRTCRFACRSKVLATCDAQPAPVAASVRCSLRYGDVIALDGIDLDIPAGRMVGLIGPDGVGKSSLLSLLAGARIIQDGTVEVLGGDMASKPPPQRKSARASPTCRRAWAKTCIRRCSVEENLQFFAPPVRPRRGRAPPADRRAHPGHRPVQIPGSARQASCPGGMKQKLGLCCALIHDPDFLILDEPTTGVDPLARAQFWDLIDRIRADRPGMSVIVATAYMDEAQRFDWLAAIDDGKVLATGTPKELLARTGSPNLEEAFIRLLPEEKKRGHQAVVIPPLVGWRRGRYRHRGRGADHALWRLRGRRSA